MVLPREVPVACTLTTELTNTGRGAQTLSSIISYIKQWFGLQWLWELSGLCKLYTTPYPTNHHGQLSDYKNLHLGARVLFPSLIQHLPMSSHTMQCTQKSRKQWWPRGISHWNMATGKNIKNLWEYQFSLWLQSDGLLMAKVTWKVGKKRRESSTKLLFTTSNSHSLQTIYIVFRLCLISQIHPCTKCTFPPLLPRDPLCHLWWNIAWRVQRSTHELIPTVCVWQVNSIDPFIKPMEMRASFQAADQGPFAVKADR